MLDLARYSTARYIVGIDEAGRGPIAGPVAVGVVALPVEFVGGATFRDSKGLPQHKREVVFGELRQRTAQGAARYAVAQTGAAAIDRFGIGGAVNRAMARALRHIDIAPEECVVLLDGGLRAPAIYRYQETIIKGDEKVYAIALASIAAKVTRDAYMRRASWRYPQYGFEAHKGYGTREHYKTLKAHGLCDIHRRSFLKGLTDCKSKV